MCKFRAGFLVYASSRREIDISMWISAPVRVDSCGDGARRAPDDQFTRAKSQERQCLLRTRNPPGKPCLASLFVLCVFVFVCRLVKIYGALYKLISVLVIRFQIRNINRSAGERTWVLSPMDFYEIVALVLFDLLLFSGLLKFLHLIDVGKGWQPLKFLLGWSSPPQVDL